VIRAKDAAARLDRAGTREPRDEFTIAGVIARKETPAPRRAGQRGVAERPHFGMNGSCKRRRCSAGAGHVRPSLGHAPDQTAHMMPLAGRSSWSMPHRTCTTITNVTGSLRPYPALRCGLVTLIVYV
jgi:hypothetical protein